MNELSRKESRGDKFAFWVLVATYYQKTLEDVTVKMYAQDCIDADLEEMKEAFKKWRLSDQGHFMPLPAQILHTIQRIKHDKDCDEAMRLIAEKQARKQRMLETGKVQDD